MSRFQQESKPHLGFQSKIIQEIVHSRDLPEYHPLTETCAELRRQFVHLVDKLRDPTFPNSEINKLLYLTYELVKSGTVQTALAEGDEVDSLHFFMEVCPEGRLGMFLMPRFWGRKVEENEILCTGGLVWAASQAKDYYNEKFNGPQIMERSRAYEAEYLLTLQKENIPFTPTEYQAEMLKLYPNGIYSEQVKNLMYESKPVT